MKRIKLLAYALAASVTIWSCRDALEIVQPGEVTEEVVFKTVADLKSFLIGNVYTSVDTSNEIALTSYFTDETAITTTNSGWYFEVFRYGLRTDNSYVAGTWATHYRTINRVNRLIEAAKLMTPSPAEQAAYNSVLAEGYAVRAFSYLQLLSYFTTDMKNPGALGVILTTTVPDVYDQLPRVTNGEIYAQMEQDLNFASANLLAPADPAPANIYKYVTPQMINAVRARMYL